MRRLLGTFLFISTFFTGFLSVNVVCAAVPKDLPAARNPASINRAAMLLSINDDLSKDLIANYINMKEQMQKASFQAEEIIPTNLDPEQDRRVLSQIADKAANTFWNSSSVQSSVVGRTATKVEKTMQADMHVKDEKGIEHHFNMNFQAFQATAQMTYTGITRATLRYAATEQSLGFEVRENSILASDFVFTHTIKPDDELSRMSLEWKF